MTIEKIFHNQSSRKNIAGPRGDQTCNQITGRVHIQLSHQGWLSDICLYEAGLSDSGAQLTGDQEVADYPNRVGNILLWRLNMNIFYDYSLPSTDSRRAVVSFWQKNAHNTG